MEQILTISQYILIIGWALGVILLIIVLLYIILILIKINAIVSDIYEKYQFTMEILTSPVKFIYHLISKIK